MILLKIYVVQDFMKNVLHIEENTGLVHVTCIFWSTSKKLCQCDHLHGKLSRKTHASVVYVARAKKFTTYTL